MLDPPSSIAGDYDGVMLIKFVAESCQPFRSNLVKNFEVARFQRGMPVTDDPFTEKCIWILFPNGPPP